MAILRQSLKLDSLNDFPLQQLRLFDDIDENIIACWRGQCAAINCQTLTSQRAVQLHASLETCTPFRQHQLFTAHLAKTSTWERSSIQETDIVVTQQWLHSRLWQICLSHGLLCFHATQPQLRPSYALDFATEAHQGYWACAGPSREAHGIGLIEKLFDIALSLVQARSMLEIVEVGIRDSIDMLLEKYGRLFWDAPEDMRSFALKLQKARG